MTKEKTKNKILDRLIEKVEKKFKKYFVAYGAREYKGRYFINIIIDDRDVMKMEKEELRVMINLILKRFIKEVSNKIKAKCVFISDLNKSNIWNILEKKAVIFNAKITSSFVKIKLPDNFLKIYKKLPKRFKLSDFSREISKISKKEHHRNTYQNWLKSLKNAGFLKLKNKTYYKVEEPYKKTLLNNLKKTK